MTFWERWGWFVLTVGCWVVAQLCNFKDITELRSLSVAVWYPVVMIKRPD
jgi:hypothetical protein